MKKTIRVALAILAVMILVSCGSKNSSSVSTDGSTSMEKVIGGLGEAFQINTDIKYTYNPTGSGSGIKAVQEGRCDIRLSIVKHAVQYHGAQIILESELNIGTRISVIF